MDCIYLALFRSIDHSKCFTQHSLIQTHVHIQKAEEGQYKVPPAHLKHTDTHMEEILGSVQGSVFCPRTHQFIVWTEGAGD